MKFAVLMLLLCGIAVADPLEKHAAGSGKLGELMKAVPGADPRSPRFYLLVPAFRGSVLLVHHRGEREKVDRATRDMHLNAFTPEAGRFGDPGEAKAKLPAIFSVGGLDGDSYGTGDFVFRGDAPGLDAMKSCETLGDLRKVVPGLLEIQPEGAESPSYGFSWFSVGKDGKVQVTLLSAGCDAEEKIKRMEVWSGSLAAEAGK